MCNYALLFKPVHWPESDSALTTPTPARVAYTCMEDWSRFLRRKWARSQLLVGVTLKWASANRQYRSGRSASVQWSPHMSSTLLVWPRRKSLLNTPSVRVLGLHSKNGFVEKNKLCSEQMSRIEKTSGSQGGKAIHQQTDKPIKDPQVCRPWW